jgi:hypothetical protein
LKYLLVSSAVSILTGLGVCSAKQVAAEVLEVGVLEVEVEVLEVGVLEVLVVAAGLGAMLNCQRQYW